MFLLGLVTARVAEVSLHQMSLPNVQFKHYQDHLMVKPPSTLISPPLIMPLESYYQLESVKINGMSEMLT